MTAVNDPPTLNVIPPRTINEDAALQTVGLSGISAGGGETQALTVTAVSSDAGLIPNPVEVLYLSGATGSLRFKPVAHANGTATITVTVKADGGLSPEEILERSFNVTGEPSDAISIVHANPHDLELMIYPDEAGQKGLWGEVRQPDCAPELAEAFEKKYPLVKVRITAGTPRPPS